MYYTNVPIVIICKDRINYLDLELKSISSTCPSSTQVIVSNDGTKNKNTLRYLNTQDPISIGQWSFPPKWPQLTNIPTLDTVQGVGGKLNMLLWKVSAGTKNLGLAVKYAFERTGSPYVIKMEDDLIFIKNWYALLINAIQDSGCDLLSGFRFFYNKTKAKPFNDIEKIYKGYTTGGQIIVHARSKPETRPINNVAEEVYRGYTGGQLMICSRKYYDRCPYVFNNEISTIWDNDDLWIDQCRKNGMKFGVTNKSVCQHIGTQTESQQHQFSAKKLDLNVKTTICGDHIKSFRKVR